MQTDEALDALLRVEYVRRRTRDRLRGGWFPPGLFGALFLVSLGPAITSSRLLTAIYWAIAGPCAIATIALYYGRRQDQTGSRGLVGPEVVCAVGLWAAALLLAGVGGYATSLTLWWLYYPQVGWGLPVLGVVTLAPVGAPLAVVGAYLVAAAKRRTKRTLAVGIVLAALLFLVGAMALALSNDAALASISAGAGASGVSTLSHLGTVVVYQVVPTVAYAIVLIGVALVLRLMDRTSV